MVSKANWKTWVILGVAVAVFATSAGVVVASNMGYKINKGLQNGFAAPGPKGDNWLSIPYNSPYTNSRLLCDAIFPGAGVIGRLNGPTGVTTACNCPCTIGNFGLVIGEAIRVRKTPRATSPGCFRPTSKLWYHATLLQEPRRPFERG
jgi:hypothetical protein